MTLRLPSRFENAYRIESRGFALTLRLQRDALRCAMLYRWDMLINNG